MIITTTMSNSYPRESSVGKGKYTSRYLVHDDKSNDILFYPKMISFYHDKNLLFNLNK